MIDAHCHFDLYPNPERLIRELDRQGKTIIGMTNLPSHFEAGYRHVKPFKRIRLALGMHPLNAYEHEAEFPKFLKLKFLTSYIGEVGLDFSHEGLPTKSIQLKTFNKILASIRSDRKLLSIHSRQAEKEVLQLLIEYGIQSAIFHWYSGPVKFIHKIADNGFYFSVNSAMIKSKLGKERVRSIPRNRLLTETDGPFIERSGQPVKPGDVEEVISYLAHEWHSSNQEVETILKRNFSVLVAGIR